MSNVNTEDETLKFVSELMEQLTSSTCANSRSMQLLIQTLSNIMNNEVVNNQELISNATKSILASSWSINLTNQYLEHHTTSSNRQKISRETLQQIMENSHQSLLASHGSLTFTVNQMDRMDNLLSHPNLNSLGTPPNTPALQGNQSDSSEVTSIHDDSEEMKKEEDVNVKVLASVCEQEKEIKEMQEEYFFCFMNNIQENFEKQRETESFVLRGGYKCYEYRFSLPYRLSHQTITSHGERVVPTSIEILWFFDLPKNSTQKKYKLTVRLLRFHQCIDFTREEESNQLRFRFQNDMLGVTLHNMFDLLKNLFMCAECGSYEKTSNKIQDRKMCCPCWLNEILLVGISTKKFDTCAICMEPIIAPTELRCTHRFHRRCLIRIKEPKCPLCRASICDCNDIFDDDDDEEEDDEDSDFDDDDDEEDEDEENENMDNS